jgi:MoxR-like ATPase
VVIGRENLIERIFIAMLVRGHAIADGAWGLGKTLLLRSLAGATGLEFARVTCTPDLVPHDFVPRESPEPILPDGHDAAPLGPLSANLVLIDEFDRASPKTQAALMDAITIGEVRSSGVGCRVPTPFFVLASRNPLAPEGAYPLRPAALDRFLIHLRLDYPDGEHEWEIARRITGSYRIDIDPVTNSDEILEFQKAVTELPVSDDVLRHAWALVRSSRPNSEESPGFVDRWLAWGAGPRGLLALVSCAKARAVLRGRNHTRISDVRAVAGDVFRHRLRVNDVALADAISADAIIAMLMEKVPVGGEDDLDLP